MGMSLTFRRSNRQKKQSFFADNSVLPQTMAVLRMHAKGFGMQPVVGDAASAFNNESLRDNLRGVLMQYPDVNGNVENFAGPRLAPYPLMIPVVTTNT